MKRIKVAQFGLGPIGIESVKLASEYEWIEIVGGIDIDPAKIGQSLDRLTGKAALADRRVYPSLEKLCAAAEPEAVLHTASSSASASLQQMRPAIEKGLAVVSTCEELVFPGLTTPALAAEYDALCRKTGARVVAAGVNPGFVMDLLPLCMTGVSRSVESIYAERVVDASTRRQPLQAKIGSGRDPAEFQADFDSGRAGHAGFKQSTALLAHALGWKLDSIDETCRPKIAAERMVTKFFEVPAGRCCGLHQRCIGIVDGRARIVLDLQMYLGAPNPHDAIVVQGRPPLNLFLNGGVAGDDATVAALLNTVPRLLAAPPGVRLLTDLPLPVWANPKQSRSD